MLNITITEQTPDNMLRAIRAACNELLDDLPATSERPEAAQPALAAPYGQRDTEVEAAFNQISGPSIEELQATGQLTNVRVEPQDEAHLDLKPETDSTGAEWNVELHASTKSKNADGTWKKRRGYKETQPDDRPCAPAAPSAPPLPPAAPTAESIMPKIFALITSHIVTINQAMEAAQAEGFADLGANGLGGAPVEKQLAVLRKLEG